MDHSFILNLIKARQLYKEACELPWSEERRKTSVLKQADRACKEALAALPDELETLVLRGHVCLQLAGCHVRHPQASKRFLRRALDNFRKAAEAHPRNEKPFLLWQDVLGNAYRFAEIEPSDVGDLALECANWCERFAAKGHRSQHLLELWQGAALELKELATNVGQRNPRSLLDSLQTRRRIADVFDDMPEVLEDESDSIIRLARWLDDDMPDQARDALRYAYGLGERIEELDPGRAAAARTIEAEALMGLAQSNDIDADETVAHWRHAVAKMRAAREEHAQERDADGRPGRQEAHLITEFAADTVDLTVWLAYADRPEAELLLTTAIDLIRDLPKHCDDDAVVRRRLWVARNLMDAGQAFGETAPEPMERAYREALAIIEQFEPEEMSDSYRAETMAIIFDEMGRSLLSSDRVRAMTCISQAAEHYAAVEKIHGIHDPGLLRRWAHAALLAAVGAREAGDHDAGRELNAMALEAFELLDKDFDGVSPGDWPAYVSAHFGVFTGNDESAEGGEPTRSWDDEEVRSGMELICRGIERAEENSDIVTLVGVALLAASLLPGEDAADALRNVVSAIAASPLELETPNYVTALFARRSGDIDETFERLEVALDRSEVDWHMVSEDAFWDELHDDRRWQDLAQRYAGDAEEAPQLPFDFDAADSEHI